MADKYIITIDVGQGAEHTVVEAASFDEADTVALELFEDACLSAHSYEAVAWTAALAEELGLDDDEVNEEEEGE